jgi:hypothetical protein
MGHIPLKNDTIGMTVGATNNHIKKILTKEPPHEDQLVPSPTTDYTFYNKNYFNDNFSKDYRLEEDKIFSNRSAEAKTWISGSKFRINPQHIPGYKAHIPGIYSSNIHGQSYTKSTALAIKGEYSKNIDLPSEDRYTSTNRKYFKKPLVRHEDDGTFNSIPKQTTETTHIQDPSSMTLDNSSIYKSKIANIPTCGYAGHQSIFQKPITYLNIDKVDKNKTVSTMRDEKNELCESFRKILHIDKEPIQELPYIVGYKGFRSTVKAGNYHGKNFREISLNSKNKLLFQEEYK